MQNHVSQYKRQVSVNLSPVQIQWWANCSVEGLGIVLGLVVGGYETVSITSVITVTRLKHDGDKLTV